MKKVTIVLPSRNELFLPETVTDLLDNATGDIEVIVILDGYWTIPQYLEGKKFEHFKRMIADKRVVLLHKGQSEGMRPGINDAVAIAKGNYIMKIDAHCMVDKGFDTKLIDSCERDTVVIPRRKRLDAENWCIQDVGKLDVDYEYLSFPDNPADFGGAGFNGRIWEERIKERLNNPKYDIDENMSFQGSCWFMTKKYFHHLELMDYKNYGTFWSEAQEIGFKTYLSGGKVLINKKTWYAHLHKGRTYGRGYQLNNRTVEQGAMFSKKWVNNDVWHKQTLPFHTMIERFMPIPGWDENWMDKLGYKNPTIKN